MAEKLSVFAVANDLLQKSGFREFTVYDNKKNIDVSSSRSPYFATVAALNALPGPDKLVQLLLPLEGVMRPHSDLASLEVDEENEDEERAGEARSAPKRHARELLARCNVAADPENAALLSIEANDRLLPVREAHPQMEDYLRVVNVRTRETGLVHKSNVRASPMNEFQAKDGFLGELSTREATTALQQQAPGTYLFRVEASSNAAAILSLKLGDGSVHHSELRLRSPDGEGTFVPPLPTNLRSAAMVPTEQRPQAALATVAAPAHQVPLPVAAAPLSPSPAQCHESPDCTAASESASEQAQSSASASAPASGITTFSIPKLLKTLRKSPTDPLLRPLTNVPVALTSADAALRALCEKLHACIAPPLEYASQDDWDPAVPGGVEVIHVSPRMYLSTSDCILARVTNVGRAALADLELLKYGGTTDERPLVPALLVTIRCAQCAPVYVWSIKFRPNASVTTSLSGKWFDAVQQLRPTRDWLRAAPTVIGRSCPALARVPSTAPSSARPQPTVKPLALALADDDCDDDASIVAPGAASDRCAACEDILCWSTAALGLPPEQRGIEYKEVTNNDGTISVKKSVTLIKDNVLPMMRSAEKGCISVGVDDAGRPTLISLPKSSTDLLFLEAVKARLDEFLQGVFPRFPSTSKFVLCLKEHNVSSLSRRFTLQFYYDLEGMPPFMRHAMLHPTFNWAPRLSFFSTEAQTSVSECAATVRLTPSDVWLRARSSAISMQGELSLDSPGPKVVVGLGRLEENLPSPLRSVPNLTFLAADSAHAQQPVAFLEGLDEESRWTVIACCRNEDETRLTLEVLQRLSTASSLSCLRNLDLIMVVTDFQLATYHSACASTAGEPLYYFLQRLNISDKWNLVDIISPCARERLRARTLPSQSSEALLERGVQNDWFSILCPPNHTVAETHDLDEIYHQARDWIESGSKLTAAVFNEGLAVVPQAADLAIQISRTLSKHANGPSTFKLCKQASSALLLTSRCVGGTTVLRATAFGVMQRLSAGGNCIVVELKKAANDNPLEAVKLLRDLATAVGHRGSVLVLDDQLASEKFASRLEAVEDLHAHGSLALLRLVQRPEDDAVPIQTSLKKADATLICDQLSRLYPDARPNLEHVRANFEKEKVAPHFLLFVLTALLQKPISNLTSIKEIASNIMSHPQLSDNAHAALVALSFLSCFGVGTTMWIEKSKLVSFVGEAWLSALLSHGHFLRVRNGYVTVFHPVLAHGLLLNMREDCIRQELSYEIVEKALVSVILLYKSVFHYYAAAIPYLRMLFVGERLREAPFTPLVQQLSRLGCHNDKIIELFDKAAGWLLVRGAEKQRQLLELRAHVVIVQSRFVRKGCDRTLDQWTKGSTAVHLARHALDLAREVHGRTDTAQLFVFVDTLAWALAAHGDFDEACEMFYELKRRCDPERLSEVCSKARNALCKWSKWPEHKDEFIVEDGGASEDDVDEQDQEPCRTVQLPLPHAAPR